MTPAIRHIDQTATKYVVHQYIHTAARGYGMEAAESLGLAPEQVLKTLIVKLDGRLAMALVPVSRELDLKRLARAAGAKRATMAPPQEAQRATGYVTGGISPLGQRQQLPAYIDQRAMDHAQVYISGGKRGLELELDPADLERLCNASLATLSRGS